MFKLVAFCRNVNLSAWYLYKIYKGGMMGGRELRAILGKNLRHYRSHRKWSQADLAEQADISVTFLCEIERGKKWPYPDTLSNLAKALDIGVHELFMDDEKAADTGVKELMGRFVKDVSLTLNKSVSLSLNQSLEHLRKQYSLE
jgi:transcriptional regulator with XRE-family HTH domain